MGVRLRQDGGGREKKMDSKTLLFPYMQHMSSDLLHSHGRLQPIPGQVTGEFIAADKHNWVGMHSHLKSIAFHSCNITIPFKCSMANRWHLYNTLPVGPEWNVTLISEVTRVQPVISCQNERLQAYEGTGKMDDASGDWFHFIWQRVKSSQYIFI